MKKLLLIAALIGAGTTAFSYTFVLTNKLSQSVDVVVKTTIGVGYKQSGTIGPGQSQTFAFTKWYNTGLCLYKIEINGVESRLWLNNSTMASGALDLCGNFNFNISQRRGPDKGYDAVVY